MWRILVDMLAELKQTKPLLQTNITGLSHDGRGIGHNQGKIVFIHNALPGETVTWYRTKKRQRFEEGIALEVADAAPERVEPRCPHATLCGGCVLQHLAPEQQIKIKQAIVLEQLQHIAQLQPNELLAPITGPHWAYRRKARLGVKYVPAQNTTLIGFREKLNPRYITHINQCSVLHPNIGERIEPLKQLVNNLSIHQHIAQIEVAVGDHATALIVRHLKPLTADDQQQLVQLGQHHQFHIYLQPKGIDSIHCIWPTAATTLLSYQLPKHGLTLYFHPTEFVQVNQAINQKMIDQALELLAPDANEITLDLFCGLGNFSLPLAQHSKYVIGVEAHAASIERADYNAQINRITNTQFHCADLTKPSLQWPWLKQAYNKVLLDPPRSGAKEIIPYIAEQAPQRIVYVSCNPATLARDAQLLTQQNSYQLTQLGILDMFPHTSHIEAMALFEKGK